MCCVNVYWIPITSATLSRRCSAWFVFLRCLPVGSLDLLWIPQYTKYIYCLLESKYFNTRSNGFKIVLLTFLAGCDTVGLYSITRPLGVSLFLSCAKTHWADGHWWAIRHLTITAIPLVPYIMNGLVFVLLFTIYWLGHLWLRRKKPHVSYLPNVNP